MAKKNTDTVAAMLTPGEVVLNADQQKRLGELVGMPVSEVFKKIGVPGFAKGGKVLKSSKNYQSGGIAPTGRTKEDLEKNYIKNVTNGKTTYSDSSGNVIAEGYVKKNPLWQQHLKAQGGTSKYYKNEAEFNKHLKEFRGKHKEGGSHNLQGGGIANTPVFKRKVTKENPNLRTMRKIIKMAGGGRVGKPKRSDIYRGIYLAKVRNR